MAGAERLCNVFQWGREIKMVGKHCFNIYGESPITYFQTLIEGMSRNLGSSE